MASASPMSLSDGAAATAARPSSVLYTRLAPEARESLVACACTHPKLSLHGSSRTEPERSEAQSAGLLRETLRLDPIVFVRRYGQLLGEAQLGLLDGLCEPELDAHGELAWLLGNCRLRSCAPRLRAQRSVVVKNRRFNHLKEFQKSEYFGIEAMRSRRPALYLSMCGPDEDELQPEGETADNGSGGTSTLEEMGDADSAELEAELEAKKIVAEGELQESLEEQAEAHEMFREFSPSGGTGLGGGYTSALQANSAESAEAMAEFGTAMSRFWLDGEDAEFFSYDAVDLNDSLDDWHQQQQDSEERWFDDDDDDEDEGPRLTPQQQRQKARERALAALRQ